MNIPVVLISVGLLLLTACSPRSIDCGTDISCLQNNAKTCTPSTFQFIDKSQTMGSVTIEGLSDDTCEIIFETLTNTYELLNNKKAQCFIPYMEGVGLEINTERKDNCNENEFLLNYFSGIIIPSNLNYDEGRFPHPIPNIDLAQAKNGIIQITFRPSANILIPRTGVTGTNECADTTIQHITNEKGEEIPPTQPIKNGELMRIEFGCNNMGQPGEKLTTELSFEYINQDTNTKQVHSGSLISTIQ